MDGKLKILVMPRQGSAHYSITVSKVFMAVFALAVVGLLAINGWLLHGYMTMKGGASSGAATAAAVPEKQQPAAPAGPVKEARVRDLEDTARYLLEEMRRLRIESNTLDAKLGKIYNEDEIKKLPNEDKFTSPRGSLEPDLADVEKMFAKVSDAIDRRRAFIYMTAARIELAQQYVSRIPEGSPVADGRLTSPEGMRIHPISGALQFHKGVDIGSFLGDYINSAAAGVVTSVGWHGGYGIEIQIDHLNGFTTRYAHLDEVFVGKGDRVGKGDLIALMGNTGYSTGPHLHYEVLYNGRPVDPQIFMRAGRGLL